MQKLPIAKASISQNSSYYHKPSSMLRFALWHELFRADDASTAVTNEDSAFELSQWLPPTNQRCAFWGLLLTEAKGSSYHQQFEAMSWRWACISGWLRPRNRGWISNWCLWKLEENRTVCILSQLTMGESRLRPGAGHQTTQSQHPPAIQPQSETHSDNMQTLQLLVQFQWHSFV